MKLVAIANDNIEIQANVNKKGDYELAHAVANKMVELDFIDCAVAAADDRGQWVQVCAVWDNYQAIELKDLYKEAKKLVCG
jgi:hypothetical protein